MRNRLRATGRSLDKAITYVSIAFCVVMVIAGSVDVVTRVAGGAALAWAQKLAVWSAVTFSFLMTGNQVLENSHISIDIVYRRLKGLPKKVTSIINYLMLLVFSFILLISSIVYALALQSRGVTRVLGTFSVPFAPVILIVISAGSFVLFIYSIVALVNVIRAPTKTG